MTRASQPRTSSACRFAPQGSQRPAACLTPPTPCPALLALQVHLRGGERLGHVCSVHEGTGTHDLLVVRLAGQDRAVMLPYADALVPDVDLAAGRLTVCPPDGLLDLSIPLDRIPGLSAAPQPG